MTRKDLFAAAVILFLFMVVPYLELKYGGPKDLESGDVSPTPSVSDMEFLNLGVPVEFRRNFTLQVKIEGHNLVGGVQAGFREWVDGVPQPVEDWFDCVDGRGLYVFPEPLEMTFAYSHGDCWMILGKLASVRFHSEGSTVEFPEIDLDFRVPKEVYSAIFDGRIRTAQIVIGDEGPEVVYVWEGSLHEVPSKCLVFKGLSGRIVQASFPVHDVVEGYVWVKGEEQLEKLKFSTQRDRVDALALKVNDPAKNLNATFYLTSANYSLYRLPECVNDTISGTRICELLSAETVYAGGEAFDYISWVDRRQYSLLRVTTIWREELPTPREQARRLIINEVGEEYFDAYLSFSGIDINPSSSEDWLTRVDFGYNVSVGNYSRIREVNLFFDDAGFYIFSYGFPSRGNLMPFNVTREEAIEIALREGSPSRIVELETEIYYWRRLSDRTPLDKYVWIVYVYLHPKEAKTGGILEAVIDPHTGEVYEIARVVWVAES